MTSICSEIVEYFSYHVLKRCYFFNWDSVFHTSTSDLNVVQC